MGADVRAARTSSTERHSSEKSESKTSPVQAASSAAHQSCDIVTTQIPKVTVTKRDLSHDNTR